MGPTREEFDRLYETIKDGFAGVNGRLDTLNGRTLAGEIARENLRTRVVSLEKTIFVRRPAEAPGKGESWTLAFTKREGMLIGLGLAVISVLLEVLKLVGSELWHLLTKA